MNEFAFFFFLAMCMTFTDFVTDVPTRIKTASMLSTFMFVILGLNCLLCLISVISVFTDRLCVKKKVMNSNNDSVQASDRIQLKEMEKTEAELLQSSAVKDPMLGKNQS